MLPPAHAHSRGIISVDIVLDSSWKYKIFDFDAALSVYVLCAKIYANSPADYHAGMRLRRSSFYNSANAQPTEAFMKKYKQPLTLILVFFLFCAGVFLFTRNSETLSEYAERKPEIAYAAPAKAETVLVATNDPESTPPNQRNAETEWKNANANQETANAEENHGISGTDLKNTETELFSEDDPEAETAMEDRVTYQPDFYYESLSDSIKKRITGLSYKEDCTIPYEDLRYVRVLYTNFNGGTSTGELICNQAIARDLVEIFYELYQAEYQIESIRLIDEYNADDLLSMEDNNTSCFNYRTVEGTTKLSKHAQGLAIDVNPFFNPYVTYDNGKEKVSPAGSEAYADRSKPFAYKIDENDLCYKLFTEHGFIWGGHWNSCKDYQHFQKNP